MKTLTKLFTATALTIALLANTNNASADKDVIDRVACNLESAAVMSVYTHIKILTKSGMDKEAAFSNARASYVTKAGTHEARKYLIDTVNLVDSNYDQLEQMNAEQIKAFTFNQCVNSRSK